LLKPGQMKKAISVIKISEDILIGPKSQDNYQGESVGSFEDVMKTHLLQIEKET
jgi:hypothetical protein